MVRWIYSALCALVFPLVLLKLSWRGYKAPEYRARILERLGLFDAPTLNQPIWFHTVSVGEFRAAEPIIRKILEQYPTRDVVITTMTPTSSALIDEILGDRVFHVYSPYDFPVFVNWFLQKVKPELLLILETELWPNMIYQTHQSGCPIMLVNARLSERSAKGYQRFLPALGWMLSCLDRVMCQTQDDASRFKELGIAEENIWITGSIKYDVVVQEELISRARSIGQALGEERKVFVVASTHEGEDEQILAAYPKLKEKFPDTLLIVVPRHPERFEAVFEHCRASASATYRRSLCESIPSDADIFVVDTIGELLMFYVLADLAFVGGSFKAVGGHNPLEVAAVAKPVAMGPHYFNFEVICDDLAKHGGLAFVKDAEALIDWAIRMFEQDDARLQMGAQAKQVIESGKGAVDQVMKEIGELAS